MIDCTFCGDKGVPRGREDVFPRWLAEKLAYVARQHHPDIETTYVNYNYEHLADFGTTKTTGETKTGAIPAAFHLPDVYIKCNRGWMGRLEGAAKLVMVGLLAGQPKALAPYDQFVLGMWTTKTSLTYDAARETRWILEKLGTNRLFRSGYPLPGVHVAIGHDPNHTPDGSLAHGRQELNGGRLAAKSAVALDMHAIRFAFQFDHLILEAIINYGEDFAEHPEGVLSIPVKPPYFKQVWPPVPRYDWPSPAALVRRP